MRILLVAARYLPNRGGLETVVHEIADQMREAGHTVAIVTNRYPKRLSSHDVIDHIPVTRLHFLLPRGTYLKARRIDLWLAAWVFCPLSLITLFRLIRRFRPDVVNVHYLGVPAFFVWLLQKMVAFPLIVSLHGGDVDSEPYENRFNHWLFQTVVQCANQVTACSQVLLTQALSLVPSIESKALVIHNGVDVARFATTAPYPYDNSRRYVLGIGQLVKHKGFDLLISAFAFVAAQWPTLDLILAGGGPEHDALDKQVQDAGLASRIKLLGAVDHLQVAALMRGSQAIVIPSRREPFGIVGLEALATGRPIIASRIDGLVEALAGAEVSWFISGNITSLTQQLTNVLSDPGNATALFTGQAENRANQMLAQEQSWQRVTERYLTVFANALPPEHVR